MAVVASSSREPILMLLEEREGGVEEVPPASHKVVEVAERDAPRLEADMALMRRFLHMTFIFPRDRCFVMVASLNVLALKVCPLAGGTSVRVIISCSVEPDIMFYATRQSLYSKSLDADYLETRAEFEI